MESHSRKSLHAIGMNMRSTITWCFECDMEVEEAGERLRVALLKNARKAPKKTNIKISPPSSITPRGIMNIGNTCFAAATLQCLRHTIPFETLLRSIPPYSDHELQPGTASQKLVVALRNFFQESARQSNMPPYDPYEIISAVQRLNALFHGFQQHDAQEFLRFILSTIHDDLKFNQGKERGMQSLVSSVFAGETVSTVTCLTCGKDSKCTEQFFDMSLPVPVEKSNPAVIESSSSIWTRMAHSVTSTLTSFGMGSFPTVDLADCLALFLATEKLSGPDAYLCEHCKRKTESLKKMNIPFWPETLVVHLKRFRAGGYKLSQSVTFPVDDLFEGVYQVYALLEHLGSNSGGGHYIAYCRDGNSWIRYDDSRATPGISSSQIQSSVEPYILFFKRVDKTGSLADVIIPGEGKLIFPRRWLCEIETTSRVPPLVTTDIVCRHGHPSTTCPTHAGRIFSEISGSEYTGPLIGPRIRAMTICEICSELVDRFNRRLAIEHKLVTRLDSKNLEEGQVWYFIDATWVASWRQYLRRGSVADVCKLDSPGRVSNKTLAEKFRKNQTAVKMTTDFVAVNKYIWSIFLHCHGHDGTVDVITCASLDPTEVHVKSTTDPSIDTEFPDAFAAIGVDQTAYNEIQWSKFELD
jgi:ubiquitin C-terminal hydrolase